MFQEECSNNHHSIGGTSTVIHWGRLSPTRRLVSGSGSAESSGRRGEVGGRGGYIPLAIVIETELEDVVNIRPGMPEMLNFIERVLRKLIRLVLRRPHGYQSY